MYKWAEWTLRKTELNLSGCEARNLHTPQSSDLVFSERNLISVAAQIRRRERINSTGLMERMLPFELIVALSM